MCVCVCVTIVTFYSSVHYQPLQEKLVGLREEFIAEKTQNLEEPLAVLCPEPSLHAVIQIQGFKQLSSFKQ